MGRIANPCNMVNLFVIKLVRCLPINCSTGTQYLHLNVQYIFVAATIIKSTTIPELHHSNHICVRICNYAKCITSFFFLRSHSDAVCLVHHTLCCIYDSCLLILICFDMIYVDCRDEYNNVRYCERFHLNESGWRECKFCEKVISISTIS